MNEAMKSAFDLAYKTAGEDAWHDTGCDKIFAMGWQAALSQQPITSCNFGDAVRPNIIDCLQVSKPDVTLINEGNMLSKEKYSDIVSDGGLDMRDRGPSQPSCEPASIIDTEIRLSFSGFTGVYQDDEGNYVRLSDYEALRAENAQLKEEKQNLQRSIDMLKFAILEIPIHKPLKGDVMVDAKCWGSLEAAAESIEDSFNAYPVIK